MSWWKRKKPHPPSRSTIHTYSRAYILPDKHPSTVRTASASGGFAVTGKENILDRDAIYLAHLPIVRDEGNFRNPLSFERVVSAT